VAHIISAALVSRGSHNAAQGRRFLADHRMLVAHTLKRSAGIGHVEDGLSESVAELADSFVVMIVATEFLEVSFLPVSVRKFPMSRDGMRRVCG
jgi:nuclear pore complex protein Nup205